MPPGARRREQGHPSRERSAAAATAGAPLNEIGVGYTFTGDLRARVYGPFTLSVGMGQSFAHTGHRLRRGHLDQAEGRLLPRPRLLRPARSSRSRGCSSASAPGPVFAPAPRWRCAHERRRVEGGTQWIESATFKAKGTGRPRSDRERDDAEPEDHPGPRRRLPRAQPRSQRQRQRLPRLEPYRRGKPAGWTSTATASPTCYDLSTAEQRGRQHPEGIPLGDRSSTFRSVPTAGRSTSGRRRARRSACAGPGEDRLQRAAGERRAAVLPLLASPGSAA